MTDPNMYPSTDPTTNPNTDPTTTPSARASEPVTLSKSAPAPAPAPEPVPAPVATPPRRRRRPLFPTILWGILMLALAAFIAARELVPGDLDLVTWMLTAVVAIGILLVVAGIAAASRRAG